MSGAGPVLGWAGLGWAGRVYEHELFTICSSNCHQLSPAAGAEQLTRHRACIITRVPASSHLTPARVSCPLHLHTLTRVSCRHYYHSDCTCARVKLYLSEAQSTCGVHHHTRHRYHHSSHWLYISRATHVYTVDICGRRNWKPIIWLEHREMWQNIKLGHFIASLSPSLRCNGILSFPHHTHCI